MIFFKSCFGMLGAVITLILCLVNKRICMKMIKICALKVFKTLALICVLLHAVNPAFCDEVAAKTNGLTITPTVIDKNESKPIEANVEKNAVDKPLLKLQTEQNSDAITIKGNEVVKLKLEQNILNLPTEKKFESGVIKDIKIIGGEDISLQMLMEKGQDIHTLGDGRIFVIGVSGHFRDKANTAFLLDFAPTLDVPRYGHLENQLFEAYITRKLNEHTSVRIGQQRTPNLVEGSRSVFGLPVGRRARFASTYSNITAIGAQVLGNYDRFEYRAGVFDSGRFMKYVFDDMPEVAGLVTFKPIKNKEKYGDFRIGASYDAGRRHTNYSVVGAHASYDYKKAHLDTEFGYADGYSGRSISQAKSLGYHVTALYDISPKIQGFCRLDHFNPNIDLTHVASNEYSAGMHYYLKGKKARLTLSYIFLDNQTGNNSNRIFSMLELLP